MSGLDIFVPEPRVIRAGGRDWQVAPLPIGRFPAFHRALEPIAGALLQGNLLEAVAADYEACRRAVLVGTGTEDSDAIDDLMPDDFVALFGAVIEVNADFFLRRVRPALAELAAAVTRLIATAKAVSQTVAADGPASSPSSSAADTASATSSA